MRQWFLVAALTLLGCQQATPPPTASPAGVAPAVTAPTAETPAAGPKLIEGVNEGTDPEPAPAVAPKAASPDARGWSASSADGAAVVQLELLGSGLDPAHCTISSTVTPPNGEPLRVMWKWNTCIATGEQLRFVSPDGRHLLVVDPLPEPVGEQGLDAEVVTLYEQGLRVKFLRAGAAVAALDARRWLGVPPAYSADGTGITFGSLDGRAFTLGFDGRGFPPAADDVRAFMASEGLYRYQDEKGTTQVVNSVDHIPERYRGQARSVKAKVAVDDTPKPPKPPVPATAGAPASAPAKPSAPQLPPSKDPINEARETVEKVQDIRREQERILESLH